MKKSNPKEKPDKKARKQLDSEQRATRTLYPVTKKAESKKERSPRAWRARESGTGKKARQHTAPGGPF